jgi:UDP-N-acetylglucosamine 4-epimerase
VSRWDDVRVELRERPRLWLVSGAAGFIGSHLVEELLRLGQRVRGLDDLSTGSRANLEDAAARASADRASDLEFIEGDIRDPAVCESACAGSPLVLHQAALGSVPRSVEDPISSFSANVAGFANLIDAARRAGCGRFVYASSSSVYGDDPRLPKLEAEIGEPLSPYAASKRIDEIWAGVYFQTYGTPVVGLRYFNVFGPRQDPDGPYAAVIPRWLEALLAGKTPVVYGDGETSRDFCPVGNVVQANLLAALAPEEAFGRAFNVALGGRTNLRKLFVALRDGLAALGVDCADVEPRHEDFRTGDVRHSLADVSAARDDLGYAPDVDFASGVETTLEWFVARSRS